MPLDYFFTENRLTDRPDDMTAIVRSGIIGTIRLIICGNPFFTVVVLLLQLDGNVQGMKMPEQDAIVPQSTTIVPEPTTIVPQPHAIVSGSHAIVSGQHAITPKIRPFILSPFHPFSFHSTILIHQ